VNLILRTQDVLHSFWVPQLAGKRDLIANHTNYIWFTPDPDMPTTVWNGFCTEYCGSSHANMRFRVVTVDSAQFEGWIQRQQSPAAFTSTPAAATGIIQPTSAAASQPNAVAAVQTAQANLANGPAATPKPQAGAALAQPALPAAGQLVGYVFPSENVPAYARPHGEPAHPIAFNDALKGDPANGEKLFGGAGTCLACHTITGNPMAIGKIGPNLTHIGSRIAIGAGIFQNDAAHLARWIKNAPVMKPGVIMPTLGKGQIDPKTNQKIPGGLDDQQIADIVAYLQALK
jgi:cytochrome c oxidase subunit 2